VPRPLRAQIAGGIYHITARGNRGQALFVDDYDRRLYLSLIDATVRRYGWRCHAYCLMNNHVHLVIETPRPNLSAGIQYLNGRYAQLFNHHHGLTGHLFQGRFHSVHVKSDPQLLVLIRYLALNPVRAGLCSAAVEWPWGSYPALLGRAGMPRFLDARFVLDMFGASARSAAAALETFVFDAPARAGP
jgi:REP element-mobilizing transposase RayT